MAKRDFFKDAIAEAKTIKETAIVNAKAALEESITPQLKDILSQKIAEMEEEDEMDEEPISEEMYDEELEEMDEIEEEDVDLEELLREMESDKEIEDSELDEILAEIEDDEESDEEEAEEEEDEEEEMEEEDEVELEDMTDEDLKTFIEDVISDMVAAGELEAGEGFEGGDDEDMEMDLDMEMDDEESEMEELDENHFYMELNEVKKQLQSAKKELVEAKTTINTLSSDLKEVNLLNAKMLYMNKIFRAKNLTESQKVKVLKAFDKVTTVKETELVYETLNEGLINTTKKPIKESLGVASKPLGAQTKKQIIETNPVVARWQKLAGIN